MPSGKTKEDTWRSSELEKEIRDAKDDKRKRDKDKDREKKREKHRDDGDEKRHKSKRRDDDREDRHKDRDKEKRHRDKENGEKHRDRDKDRDRERRSKDDDRRKDEKDRKKRGDEDEDAERRHRRHRDHDEDKERRHRKHRDENGEDRDKDRKHRRHRDEDGDEAERRHMRHRNEDENEEGRNRRHDDDERRRSDRKHGDDNYYKDIFSSGQGKSKDDRERKHRRHRDDDEGEDRRRHRQHKDEDEEGEKKRDKDRKRDDDDRKHRKPRDDDDRKKHRDDDDRKKHRDDDGKRRHRDDDDKRRKHRDEDEDRKHKRRDDEDEEERRRRKEKEREKRKKEKEEEERKKREEEEKLKQAQKQYALINKPRIITASPSVVSTIAGDFNYSDDFESASCDASSHSSLGHTPNTNHITKTREENTVSNPGPSTWPTHEFAAYVDDEEMDGLITELRLAEAELGYTYANDPETMISRMGEVKENLDMMFGEYVPVASPDDISATIQQVEETNLIQLESVDSMEVAILNQDSIKPATHQSDPKDICVKPDNSDLQESHRYVGGNDGDDIDVDVIANTLVSDVLHNASFDHLKSTYNKHNIFKRQELPSQSSGSSVSVKLEASRKASSHGTMIVLANESDYNKQMDETGRIPTHEEHREKIENNRIVRATSSTSSLDTEVGTPRVIKASTSCREEQSGPLPTAENSSSSIGKADGSISTTDDLAVIQKDEDSTQRELSKQSKLEEIEKKQDPSNRNALREKSIYSRQKPTDTSNQKRESIGNGSRGRAHPYDRSLYGAKTQTSNTRPTVPSVNKSRGESKDSNRSPRTQPPPRNTKQASPVRNSIASRSVNSRNTATIESKRSPPPMARHPRPTQPNKGSLSQPNEGKMSPRTRNVQTKPIPGSRVSPSVKRNQSPRPSPARASPARASPSKAAPVRTSPTRPSPARAPVSPRVHGKPHTPRNTNAASQSPRPNGKNRITGPTPGKLTPGLTKDKSPIPPDRTSPYAKNLLVESEKPGSVSPRAATVDIVSEVPDDIEIVSPDIISEQKQQELEHVSREINAESQHRRDIGEHNGEALEKLELDEIAVFEKKKEEEEDGGDDYDYDDDFEDYDDDFEDDDGDDDDDDDRDKKPARKRRGRKPREAAAAAAQNGSDEEVDDEEDDDDPYNLSLNSAEQIQTFHSPGHYKSYESGWCEDPDKFNSEMDEILQAMNEENDRLLADASKKGNWSDSTEDDRGKDTRPKTAGNRTFINFVSAKQRAFSDKVSNKARRRGIELQQIVEFDVSSFDLFDMPPVKEYDMYIRSFGSSNTKQAYIQTNEDNIDRDIQTEEIEYRTMWTQQPPDDLAGFGGEVEDDSAEKIEKEINSVRLSKFLASAGQVMAVILEEDFADRVQSDLSRKQSNICVSDAYLELSSIPMLEGRHVVASRFSPIQTHMLLLAYSLSQSEDLLAKQGAICVWNVNEPSQPHKLLMCESQPRCCCFSPMKSTLVFAGMSDGSLAVWDLREAATVHKPYHDGKEDRYLRYPTYNTAGVLNYENHGSAIVALSPIVAQGDSSSGSGSGEAGESLSFQLATLEESAMVHLWVVAEISNPDMAGSESDLGLAPGGRIKLIKSSSIVLESPLRDQRFRTTMKCFDMQLLPANNSHYYVATDVGCVIHGVRYGGKAPPKAHRTEFDALVEVTSVDFSPFTEPVFLAGCADGSLRLYHVDGENPVISWPNATDGRPIKMVRFCRSRPSVFFVLDNQSCIYIWDLNMDDAMPLKSERIAKTGVTSFCLSNDHSATGMGLAGRRPQMVVCQDSGAVEVHTISKEFSALMPEEVDQFATFLQKVV